MGKVPITDLPIHVYRPLDETRKCIAFIGDLPLRFKGDTPMKARNAANTWRSEEVAKEEARKDAHEKRMAALAEARAERRKDKEGN